MFKRILKIALLGLLWASATTPTHAMARLGGTLDNMSLTSKRNIAYSGIPVAINLLYLRYLVKKCKKATYTDAKAIHKKIMVFSTIELALCANVLGTVAWEYIRQRR